MGCEFWKVLRYSVNWGSKEEKFFIKCWVSVAWLWAGFSWLNGQNLNFGTMVCFWVEVWADCCLHQRLWLHSGTDNWKTILVIQIQDNKFLDPGYILSIGHMPSNGICGQFSSSLLFKRPIKSGNSCTTANLNRSPRELLLLGCWFVWHLHPAQDWSTAPQAQSLTCLLSLDRYFQLMKSIEWQEK